MNDEPEIFIGSLHELPDGRIAMTVGYYNPIKTITYHFDDDKGLREVSYEEYKTWKLRRDLKDFPNARDPLLPYDFDLLFDIKWTSQLKQALAEGHPEAKLMRELLSELGMKEP